jgi:hypothetical protein
MKPLPRGIRSFNPGNIERTTDRWLGMSADQSSDNRFVVFDGPEFGIRALMRLLINYQERHGLWSLRDMINRWAPPIENNTTAYVSHASRLTGYDPDERIDILDADTCLRVTKAIIRHENGDPRPHGRPEFWYDEATYDKASALAGFLVEKKPLSQSRTIGGSVIAATGAAAGAIYETLSESVGAATTTVEKMSFLPPDIVKWIFLAVVFMGTGAAIYARIDDSKRRVV